MEKINKMKSWFFGKFNKSDETLARLIREKRTQNVLLESRKITSLQILQILELLKWSTNIYTYTFDNTDEIYKLLLENKIIPKPFEGETETRMPLYQLRTLNLWFKRIS